MLFLQRRDNKERKLNVCINVKTLNKKIIVQNTSQLGMYLYWDQ